MKREIILHKRGGKVTIEPSEDTYIFVTPDGRVIGVEMEIPQPESILNCATCSKKDTCPIASMFEAETSSHRAAPGKEPPPAQPDYILRGYDLPEFIKNLFHITGE